MALSSIDAIGDVLENTHKGELFLYHAQDKIQSFCRKNWKGNAGKTPDKICTLFKCMKLNILLTQQCQKTIL